MRFANDAPDAPELTVGEAVIGVAIVGVTVVATVSLALAMVGAHDLAPVLALSLLLLAAVAVLLLRSGRPHLRLEWTELGALAVVTVVAGVMFLPGFPYAAGDKDPGIYVIHGMAIAREGSTSIEDEIAQASDSVPIQHFSAGARFPALWVDHDRPGYVLPQFYHLFPALLATAMDAGGATAVFQLNPLLAVLTVLAMTVAVRRGFGWPTALVGAALLSTNMLQVWQAKYPATEILTQLFVVGATLAVVIAIETRWRPAAGIGGFLAAATWLARPDGFLVVFLCLGVLAALVAARRFDARAGWFAGGLALGMPFVLYQTYVSNKGYSYTTDVPKPSRLVLFIAVLAIGALVGRFVVPHLRPLYRPTVLGWLIVAGVVAIGVLAWNRETLFGIDELNRNGVIGRSYDEANLHRLAMYFTVPGLLLLVGGVAVVALRPWKATQWTIVGPGLAILPVYLYAARISPQMMWWGRRFIPMVVVSMVVLIAAAIGWLLESRGPKGIPLQVVGAVATLFLLGTYLSHSLPLREHREFAGSYDFARSVGAVAGDDPAVFLWQFPGGSIMDPARTFGGPLWFVDDRLSALLPRNDPNDPAINAYLEEFGDDHDIYVVTRGLDEPAGFDTSRLELVDQLDVEMPIWDDSNTIRPDETLAEQGAPVRFTVSIWRVAGPSTVPPVPNANPNADPEAKP